MPSEAHSEATVPHPDVVQAGQGGQQPLRQQLAPGRPGPVYGGLPRQQLQQDHAVRKHVCLLAQLTCHHRQDTIGYQHGHPFATTGLSQEEQASGSSTEPAQGGAAISWALSNGTPSCAGSLGCR